MEKMDYHPLMQSTLEKVYEKDKRGITVASILDGTGKRKLVILQDPHLYKIYPINDSTFRFLKRVYRNNKDTLDDFFKKYYRKEEYEEDPYYLVEYDNSNYIFENEDNMKEFYNSVYNKQHTNI